jgi:hypothetical protein
MSRLDRSAHRAYEERHREVDAEARRRFGEVAEALRLPPPARQTFVLACMQATHFHTADCTLVDHQFRSGRSWPAEAEAERATIQERQWATSLGELRSAVPAHRAAEPEAAGEETAPTRTSHYRPLASLTRQPEE